MNLIPSARFIADLKKLERGNTQLKRAIAKTLYHLRINPGHPSLRLHKLAGERTYSISVNMSIRIIFMRFEDDVYLLRIGTHEDVY